MWLPQLVLWSWSRAGQGRAGLELYKAGQGRAGQGWNCTRQGRAGQYVCSMKAAEQVRTCTTLTGFEP